jgi:hypothetical protein
MEAAEGVASRSWAAPGALSFATWLEAEFDRPWENGLRPEAMKLAAWVRSTVKK